MVKMGDARFDEKVRDVSAETAFSRREHGGCRNHPLNALNNGGWESSDRSKRPSITNKNSGEAAAAIPEVIVAPCGHFHSGELYGCFLGLHHEGWQ
jgi:hypothetical protein